jgi:uncharacterized GH25 family protein
MQMRQIRTGLLALLAIGVGAGDAAAHYTYIVPQNFRVSSGDTVLVGFHSGDGFPESSAILKRLQDPTVHSEGGTFKLDGLREDGERLAVALKVAGSGHTIVTAVNAANIGEMKPDSFERYLREEGLGHIVEARAQRGESDDPARERYTMYAKTIFVADAPSEGYKKVVRLPLEIVPENDPYRLRPGESLPVRVLLYGVPVANMELTAASTAPGFEPRVIGKTDANGRLTVPVGAGAWRLHTIHMERAAESDVDWESLWTTLTFEIP